MFITLKIARLLRVTRVARKLDQFAHYSSVMLLLLVLVFALGGHWLACLWYTIGLSGSCEVVNGVGIPQNASWLNSLALEFYGHPFEFDPECNLNSTNSPPDLQSKLYVSALYFIMTSLTSVGFGNISANTKQASV